MPATVFIYHVSPFSLSRFRVRLRRLGFSARYSIKDLEAHWLFLEHSLSRGGTAADCSLADVVSLIDGTHFFSMQDMAHAARSLCAIGECIELQDSDNDSNTADHRCELVFRLTDESIVSVLFDLDARTTHIHHRRDRDADVPATRECELRDGDKDQSIHSWALSLLSAPFRYLMLMWSGRAAA